MNGRSQSGDNLVNIRFGDYVCRDLRESALCKFDRRDRLAIEDVEIVRSVGVAAYGIVGRRIEVDRVVDFDPLDFVVVTTEDNGMNGAALVGINVKVVDRIVFRGLRDICGRGNADNAVRSEEAHGIELVLACIVRKVDSPQAML